MLKVVGGTDYIQTPQESISYFNEEAQIQAEAEALKKELEEKLKRLKEIEFEKKQDPKFRKDGGLKETPNNNCVSRRVSPIARKEDVEKVKAYLFGKIKTAKTDNKKLTYTRDYMLFVYGINLGLRVSDLLNLKWSDILSSVNPVVIRKNYAVKEKKTGKIRQIVINNSIFEVTKNFIEEFKDQINLNGFIFSKKGDKPFSDEKVNLIIKEATSAVGLEGNFSTHSLRKTFARQIFNKLEKEKNPDAPALTTVQTLLNHNSQTSTLCYIGITSETLTGVVNDLNI